MRARRAVVSALAIASAGGVGMWAEGKAGLTVIGDKAPRSSIARWSATDKLGARSRIRRAHEAGGARKIPLARRRALSFVAGRGAAAFDKVRDGGPRRGRGARRLRDGEGGQVVVRDRTVARITLASPGQAGRRATSASRSPSTSRCGAGTSRSAARYVVRTASRVAAVVDNTGENEDARASSGAATRAAGAGDEVAVRVRPGADGRRGAAGARGRRRRRRGKRARRSRPTVRSRSRRSRRGAARSRPTTSASRSTSRPRSM